MKKKKKKKKERKKEKKRKKRKKETKGEEEIIQWQSLDCSLKSLQLLFDCFLASSHVCLK